MDNDKKIIEEIMKKEKEWLESLYEKKDLN